MYCGLLTCFFFFNLGRGIGTCSGRSWSMNLTFKHTSNRSGCISWFSTKSFTFPGHSLGRREQGTHSSFLGMLFFTIKQIISRKWMLSMKVSMELRRVFLEWSLQWAAQVMCPLLGTSWGFSPWQTPQSGLKIKQHLSSSWGWAGRGSGEGFCVVLGFFCFWVCFGFSPLSSFWQWAPRKVMLLLCQAGFKFQALKCFTSMKRRKRGGRRKKKKKQIF